MIEDIVPVSPGRGPGLPVDEVPVKIVRVVVAGSHLRESVHAVIIGVARGALREHILEGGGLGHFTGVMSKYNMEFNDVLNLLKAGIEKGLDLGLSSDGYRIIEYTDEAGNAIRVYLDPITGSVRTFHEIP